MDLILRALVRLLNDSDVDVLSLAWNIFNIISKVVILIAKIKSRLFHSYVLR